MHAANEDTIPDTSIREMRDESSLSGNVASSFPMVPSNGHSNLDVSSGYMPPDQIRMIQNINALISEVLFIPLFIYEQFLAGWFLLHFQRF